MDVSQYLEIFLDETKEHLQNLNTQILELEQDSENMDTVMTSLYSEPVHTAIRFSTVSTVLTTQLLTV